MGGKNKSEERDQNFYYRLKADSKNVLPWCIWVISFIYFIGYAHIIYSNRKFMFMLDFLFRYDIDERHKNKTCGYNQNKFYVVFSALGSFFLPLIVMLYVYVKISRVIARRHTTLHVLNQPMRKVIFHILLNDTSPSMVLFILHIERAVTE